MHTFIKKDYLRRKDWYLLKHHVFSFIVVDELHTDIWISTFSRAIKRTRK